MKFSRISPSTSLLLLAFAAAAAAASEIAAWRQLNEDLSEYSLIESKNASSSRECALTAGDERAVTYSTTGDKLCKVYRCRLGAAGCRKCRNVANRKRSQVWLRISNSESSSGSIKCWRTFQHRVDASVDFYCNWNDYVTGFGDGENNNFWLGLSNIHSLTHPAGLRVRWEMSDWNASFYWAENQHLRVESEANKFRAWLGPLDADASNVGQRSGGITGMNGMRFTTKDRDNDLSAANCAMQYTGAWWYNACHAWNPNGRYFTPPQALDLGSTLQASGIVYNLGAPPLSYLYSLRTIECLLWHSLQL